MQKAAGGPGRSQIRWNDDSVWFRWSPAVPLCPTDSYIQRAHNHLTFAQPSQYETLARAELLELLSVLQTLSKGGGERKHFFDQQQSQSIDLYSLPHRTKQVCAKWNDCSVFCKMLQMLSKEAEGQTNTFCEPAKHFKAMQMRKEEHVIAGIKFQSITQLVQLLVRKVKSSTVQGNKGTNDLFCEDPS